MKRIVAVFVFCLLASPLSVLALPLSTSADSGEKAAALLAGLSKNIAALGDYRVEFGVGAEGGQILGSYIVSGPKFRIVTPEFEVIGDGVSRYEINHELREVVADAMDTTDVNILVNPVKAFEFAKEGFVPSYKGEVQANGKVCDMVEMKPALDGSAITQVKLYVARDTGLPVRLEYLLDGIDEKVSVTVSSFKKDTAIKLSDFVFDRSKYKGYEVVDFR